MPSPDKVKIYKFRCTSCGQKLSAPYGLEGEEFDCPSCETRVRVPKEIVLDAPESESEVKFRCNQCGQKLSCRADNEERSIECPACHRETAAPVRGHGIGAPVVAGPWAAREANGSAEGAHSPEAVRDPNGDFVPNGSSRAAEANGPSSPERVTARSPKPLIETLLELGFEVDAVADSPED